MPSHTASGISRLANGTLIARNRPIAFEQARRIIRLVCFVQIGEIVGRAGAFNFFFILPPPPRSGASATFFHFPTHAAHQIQFGLGVDIMQQLEVLHEASRPDIVGMRDDEFPSESRGDQILTQFAGAQRPVAEATWPWPSAPTGRRPDRRPRVNWGGALADPLNWMTIWHLRHLDAPQRYGEVQFRNFEFEFYLPMRISPTKGCEPRIGRV